MPDYRIFLFALACALTTPPALAAPFCVQTESTPARCDYDDAAQCRHEAALQAGYCVANPAESGTRTGNGTYCIVLSSRDAECIYADRTSCEQDARNANGVCIEKASSMVSEDPYQLDINRNY